MRALVLAFAVGSMFTSSASGIGASCARPQGTTLASGPHTRLYRTEREVYGCWDRAARPVLLDRFADPGPDRLTFPRVAGRYAAYSTHGSAEGAGGEFTAVRLADLKTGRSATV